MRRISVASLPILTVLGCVDTKDTEDTETEAPTNTFSSNSQASCCVACCEAHYTSPRTSRRHIARISRESRTRIRRARVTQNSLCRVFVPTHTHTHTVVARSISEFPAHAAHMARSTHGLVGRPLVRAALLALCVVEVLYALSIGATSRSLSCRLHVASDEF